MQKKMLNFLALAFIPQVLMPASTYQVRAQAENAPYQAMAPLDRYLMPDDRMLFSFAFELGANERECTHSSTCIVRTAPS
jgi:hypothetical protein